MMDDVEMVRNVLDDSGIIAFESKGTFMSVDE